jgi:signal transduction histidine kinase
MVKLDNNSQILFLFKEVSIYNKLSQARTTEKLQNLMLNSISHNLYTPLNALIQLNKSMSLMLDSESINEPAEKVMHMMGVCLQQLVFTTHNILEMSKIKIGKFKSTIQEISLMDMIENIIDIFRDDMKFREIQYKVVFEDALKDHHLKVDDSRLSIVLYNLISNSVKHTSGGKIEIEATLLDQAAFALIQKEVNHTKGGSEHCKSPEAEGEEDKEEGADSHPSA